MDHGNNIVRRETENFMEIRSPVFFVILLAITYQENRKITLYPKVSKQQHQNTPLCFLSNVSSILKISWKSILPSFSNAGHRHGLLRKCRGNHMLCPQNVADCSLYQIPPITKISWKSVNTFVRNVANRQTNKQTEMKTSSCLRRRQ